MVMLLGPTKNAGVKRDAEDEDTSAAKKRFKVTGSGKILRRPTMRSHNLENKSSKRKRGFRKDREVTRGRHEARSRRCWGWASHAERQASSPRAEEAPQGPRAGEGLLGLQEHPLPLREGAGRALARLRLSRPEGARSGRSGSSGSRGSTPPPARTGSRTTSSSTAAARPGSSSTGRCSPTSRSATPPRSARSPSRRRPRSDPPRLRPDHLTRQRAAQARPQAPRPALARQARAVRRVEGEDLVEAASNAGFEPVELLVAGEDVEPELLAEVSTLAHPPRVIAVYRRDDLPRGVAAGDARAVARRATPATSARCCARRTPSAPASRSRTGCADPTGPKALRASMGALFRVPVSGFDEPTG